MQGLPLGGLSQGHQGGPEAEVGLGEPVVPETHPCEVGGYHWSQTQEVGLREGTRRDRIGYQEAKQSVCFC